MNFWDSSALLPLLIREESTDQMLKLRSESDEILSWTLTPIELLSAFFRLERDEEISPEELEDALRGLEILLEGLILIKDVDGVKQRAMRVLRLHPLKAADSLQLASALISCSDVTKGHRFITLDSRLAQAASKEGFIVLPAKG